VFQSTFLFCLALAAISSVSQSQMHLLNDYTFTRKRIAFFSKQSLFSPLLAKKLIAERVEKEPEILSEIRHTMDLTIVSLK